MTRFKSPWLQMWRMGRILLSVSVRYKPSREMHEAHFVEHVACMQRMRRGGKARLQHDQTEGTHHICNLDADSAPLVLGSPPRVS